MLMAPGPFPGRTNWNHLPSLSKRTVSIDTHMKIFDTVLPKWQCMQPCIRPAKYKTLSQIKKGCMILCIKNVVLRRLSHFTAQTLNNAYFYIHAVTLLHQITVAYVQLGINVILCQRLNRTLL